MGILKIERIGGFAGYGGANSKLRADGEIALSALSAKDKADVELMFNAQGSDDPSPVRDGFSYRITRGTGKSARVVTVPESAVPAALVSVVKDRIVR